MYRGARRILIATQPLADEPWATILPAKTAQDKDWAALSKVHNLRQARPPR